MTLTDIQRRLKAMGINPGLVDGLWGPKTAAAVSEALNRLEATQRPSVAEPKRLADPSWLAKAREYIGLREIPGSRNNPTILRWWELIKASFRDDETAWCAGYVGGVLEEVGIKSTRSAAARSYLSHGVKLNAPAVGCIVVFWRGSPSGWSGHVGFVVGKDRSGNLMVLGGNQSNEVNIKPFSKSRVLGYRWPGIWPFAERFNLPVLNSNGRVSTNES